MVSKVHTHILEDGSTVEFPRFTLDDLDNLTDHFKSELKAAAVKEAKAEKWDEAALWRLKTSYDEKSLDISQLYAAARSAKWIKVFLKKSLTKAGVSIDKQDIVIAHMSLTDKMDVAEKLILDLPEIEKHEKVEDKKVDFLESTTVSIPT